LIYFELEFCSLHSTGSKHPAQTRQKFQFIKLDFSNWISLKSSANRQGDWSLIILSYNYLLAFRCIIQPDKKQLNVKASCLISIVMGFLAIGMSIPLFLGTQLKDYVSFGAHTELNDILLCSDIRSRDMRYVY
jgi:hypothetical protein